MKNGKKMITPITLALFATILGAFAAWWSAREQDDNSKKLLEAQNKLLDAQEENKKLSDVIIQSVTGGNGYCYVNFYHDSLEVVQVDLVTESKFPLYDIEVTISPWFPIDDFSIKGEIAELNKKSINVKSQYIFKVNILPSMKGQILGGKLLGVIPNNSKNKRWFYTINFSARNGEWTQVWEFVLGNNSKPAGSNIIYKTVIENHIMRKEVIKKIVNPENPDSIINSLITEYKPFQ